MFHATAPWLGASIEKGEIGARRDLPGIEYAQKYLSHLYNRNRHARTIEQNYTSIEFFLEFPKREGSTCIEAAGRQHLAAFVEHEQDRGVQPIPMTTAPLYWHLCYPAKHISAPSTSRNRENRGRGISLILNSHRRGMLRSCGIRH